MEEDHDQPPDPKNKEWKNSFNRIVCWVQIVNHLQSILVAPLGLQLYDIIAV